MSRKMKDSGIEWIGEIPEDWSCRKIKRNCFYQEGPGLRTWQFKDEGIKVICVTNIVEPNIDFSVMTKYISEREYNDSYKHFTVEQGDVLLSSSGASWGKVAMYNGEENVILNTSTIRLHGKGDVIDNKFIIWLLRSDSTKKQLEILMTGSCQPNFGPSHIAIVFIPVPSIIQQIKIANYLDSHCTLIDQTIEKQKQVIEKMKEYKQSIITEVVTKGLNPNIPMKDSGFEWIGEIPEHWETNKFKKIFSMKKGLPITKDNLVESGISVISYGQIHSKLNIGTEICDNLIRFVNESYMETNAESLTYYGDFLFADTSEDLEGAGNYVFVNVDDKLFAGYHTLIARPISVANPKYLAYLFKTNCWRSQIRSRVSGIKLYSITQKILKSITLILPSDNEQELIVEYLDNVIKKTDLCIKNKEMAIEKLESYKKSLIYECVTGKREVK